MTACSGAGSDAGAGERSAAEGPRARRAAGFELSTANTQRIVGAAALVLVLAVIGAVTVLVGDRLIRPLRALIKAARHPADKAVRVPVTANDEIGRLSAAFNDLAEHRERLKEQVAAAHRSAADLAGVEAVHRVHRRAGGPQETHADPGTAPPGDRQPGVQRDPVHTARRLRRPPVPHGGRGSRHGSRRHRNSCIERADLSHVFDRFRRADNSRTRQTGGTSLGLGATHRVKASEAGRSARGVNRGTRDLVDDASYSAVSPDDGQRKSEILLEVPMKKPRLRGPRPRPTW